MTWSTFCYLLSFVLVPLAWPSQIVDENAFSLGLVMQCVIFCVCMFCLFYVNSRVLEVRTRERYLTLLAIKKQEEGHECTVGAAVAEDWSSHSCWRWADGVERTVHWSVQRRPTEVVQWWLRSRER